MTSILPEAHLGSPSTSTALLVTLVQHFLIRLTTSMKMGTAHRRSLLYSCERQINLLSLTVCMARVFLLTLEFLLQVFCPRRTPHTNTKLQSLPHKVARAGEAHLTQRGRTSCHHTLMLHPCLMSLPSPPQFRNSEFPKRLCYNPHCLTILSFCYS